MKKESILLFIYTMVVFVLFLLSLLRFVPIFLVMISLINYKKPILTFSFFIISQPFLISEQGVLLLLPMIIASFYLLIDGWINNKRFSKKPIVILTIFLVLFFLSTIFGYKANVITLFLNSLLLFFVTVIHTYKNDNDMNSFITALIMSGLLMLLILMYQYSNDQLDYLYGRLTFQGSVRLLANTMLIPLYVTSYRFFQERKHKGLNLLLSIAFLYILFLTKSRGALASILITYILIIFIVKISKFSTKLSNLVIASVILLIPFLYALIASLDDVSFILTMSSRLEIWKDYFGALSNRGIAGYIFGFGPGEIFRIDIHSFWSGYYSHSTIVDFFFSFGIVSAGLGMLIILKSLMHNNEQKRFFYFGMVLLIVLMYLTHGNSTSIVFFLVLGYALTPPNNLITDKYRVMK